MAAADSVPTTGERRTVFSAVRRFVKVVALVVGFGVSLLCLMALGRPLIDSAWIRLGIAVFVLVVVPLVLSARLLPKDDPARGRGLPTDVMAVTWMGFALAFAGVLRSVTSPMLAAEARALAAEDHPALAASVAFLSADSDAWAPVPAPVVVAAAAGSNVPATLPVPGAEREDKDASVPDAGVAPSAAPSRPEIAASDLSPAELFRRWAPSVVSIQADGSRGTGFVVSDDGLVATNSHVVHDERRISVKLMDGSWATEVWLVAEDEGRDLALLRIRASSLPPSVFLADSDEVAVGESAISIGNPLGLEHTLTEGIVSSRRLHRGLPFIQMSTPISPGNSGGPLFNARGEVIGVSTATIGGFFIDAQNLNLAVPSGALAEMIAADHGPAQRVGGGGGDTTGTW